ncbi:hypothetical protein Y032_0371g115 [Ancylostoma ceylanicum]|uniref:Uncharacterized protein n=1 Tax=Ancylostoma ceylanicum TaxID=53326 RepID=A0A016RU84_9BILA|nr:hypothetical protein Y032_0371g115 [Ancylostoma ceylanicum]
MSSYVVNKKEIKVEWNLYVLRATRDFHLKTGAHLIFMSELLMHSEPPRCADFSNAHEMSQKWPLNPFFRDGVCTSLLEQICVRAKTCITVDLIDRTGQDVFTRRCCCGGQPAPSTRFLERIPPLLQGAGIFTLLRMGFS